MADFHFVRPFWLLLLPVCFWLVWRLASGSANAGRWRAWVDEALQPLVLTAAASAVRGRRWLLSGAAAACTLAILALAGPTWERMPVPALRSSEALVVVLDLSRSMDAGDVEPSRLERAKLKLLSLLQRRDSGQTGLVVFSAHAFTVTPLTTDTRTIAALVSSLSSDIMPSRGSYPEAGIVRAAQLLRQAAASRGEILLVSDSGVSPAAVELARELRGEGMTLHVMAVGTAQGGPIPQAGGGFLSDGRGQVVVNRVNQGALQRLAEAGGGRFAVLTPDDRDLDRLLAGTSASAGVLADDGEELRTEIWRDQGVWLVLLLLPLLALSFRRGWVVVCVAMLTLPGQRVEAQTWADLWQRRDQQGQAAFESEDHARASELFEDPAWRAAAQYRDGQFESSAETLAPRKARTGTTTAATRWHGPVPSPRRSRRTTRYWRSTRNTRTHCSIATCSCSSRRSSPRPTAAARASRAMKASSSSRPRIRGRNSPKARPVKSPSLRASRAPMKARSRRSNSPRRRRRERSPRKATRYRPPAIWKSGRPSRRPSNGCGGFRKIPAGCCGASSCTSTSASASTRTATTSGPATRNSPGDGEIGRNESPVDQP